MARGKKLLWVLVALFLLSDVLHASERNRKYSLALKGTYTSTSKLFPTPDAIQELQRTRSIEINDIFGYGVEIRRQLGDESIEVGVGVEYIHTTKTGLAAVPGGSPTLRLPVADGYRFVPLEFTGYFIIPFSSETVKFFMGGGMGFYYGDRIYQVVNRTAQTVENRVAFGIHVLTGLDYFINRSFSVRGEVKFRDPQFEMTSKFTSTNVEYGGRTYRLSQQPFDSKVNLDGLVVTIGAVLNF